MTTVPAELRGYCMSYDAEDCIYICRSTAVEGLTAYGYTPNGAAAEFHAALEAAIDVMEEDKVQGAKTDDS